jgi:glycosyltransferase involved in cell wall biosynthesis
MWKQQVARFISPWYLHSAIDVLWVSGERQRQFAHRLGYTGDCCWSGWYACNWPEFAQVHRKQTSEAACAFLFVGKYSSEKGIDVLVEAYRQYRRQHPTPWKLVCAGKGELRPMLDDEPGIEDRGFVQPDRLPGVLRDATAFVLPSRREPWGVVLQEAAAAGKPLICSEECGAGVHLVQDGYNGYTFETESAEHLARCMTRLSGKKKENLSAMSNRSHQLSKQFTPSRWADTLIGGIKRITS